MNWAAEEFGTVGLGDKRINRRLVKRAQQFVAYPAASIPAACGDWGDTAAAYQLLDNESCDWREITETHGRCAAHRMAGLPLVLCLHDTTELDFTGQTIQGLGLQSYEARRGMYLHPTYVFTGVLRTPVNTYPPGRLQEATLRKPDADGRLKTTFYENR